MATKKGSTATAAQSATPAGGFFDIPLALIIIEEQIRSLIDQEGEEFLALVESIREKGVLESIIVTPRDGNYLLIAGERRLLACRKLGLATIPARVIDAVTARDELLALQLTENLQREDLDPIDTAQAVVEYIKARHGDEAFDTDGIINMMMNLEREPDRVKKEITDTVSVIQKISGKSLRSLERSCSLLKLPEEIQSALREAVIGVSQGYIFAANLDHPLLMDIFQKAIGEGFTNAGLEKELKKGLRPATTGGVRKRSFYLYRGSVQSMRTSIEGQARRFQEKRSGGAAERSAGARRTGGGANPGGNRRWRPCGRGAEEKTGSHVVDAGRVLRRRSFYWCFTPFDRLMTNTPSISVRNNFSLTFVP